MTTENISITVRVQPEGIEYDLELPTYTKGSEIKNEFIESGIVPQRDEQGVPFVYELIYKDGNVKLTDNKSLESLQIKNGGILYLSPKLNAG